MSRQRGYKMVTVAEQFKNERNVPKVRMSCGHVKTDPDFYYDNEAAVKLSIALRQFTDEPRKVRCYECGK